MIVGVGVGVGRVVGVVIWSVCVGISVGVGFSISSSVKTGVSVGEGKIGVGVVVGRETLGVGETGIGVEVGENKLAGNFILWNSRGRRAYVSLEEILPRENNNNIRKAITKKNFLTIYWSILRKKRLILLTLL